MNIDICKQVEIMISRYLDRSISGEDLAPSITINLRALEGISKEAGNSIGYYENFFKIEGSDLYEPNKYIDEERSDLRAFLKALND